jgi:fido (protein-threonine AMPylation protein)
VPGPAWGEDSAADEVVIAANVGALVRDLAAIAAKARDDPTLALAQQWHTRIYSGVSSVPSPEYLGAFRGAGADLADYEVVLVDRAGRVVAAGVPAADVGAELAAFAASVLQAVRSLDAVITVGSAPTTNEELLAVIQLAALVHEWVRVHPFANGNGRTARTWANWVALRYGLPPFVRIKPRPDGLLYARAAYLSMGGGGAGPNHDLTVQVFLDLLRSRP